MPAAKSAPAKETAKPADYTPTVEEVAAAPVQDPTACVVNDSRHVGRAVPGSKVCSYHTMTHRSDGTRRTT